TFGNLKEHPESWLLALLRRCVTAGWVSFAGRDHPVVVLTEEGRAVMKGARPVRLLLPPHRPGGRAAATPAAARRAGAAAPSGTRGAGTAGAETDDPRAAALFEALRRHRLQVARAEGIAPFIVASDRTLRDIAALRPRDLGELQLAHGIGPHKAERYGAGFLEVVAGRSEGAPPGEGRRAAGRGGPRGHRQEVRRLRLPARGGAGGVPRG